MAPAATSITRRERGAVDAAQIRPRVRYLLAMSRSGFPRRVVRIDEFMKMIEARPHRTLEPGGLATGFVFFEGCLIVTRVSHQHGSRNHSMPEAAWLPAESRE